jgi:Ca-activated chloride channel family protein
MLLRRLALSVVNFVFTLAVALFCAPRCLAQNCAKRVDPLGFVIGVSATSSNGADPCSSVNMRMAETSGPWTIRKRVDEVMVFFTVTNGRNFVNDLTQREVYVKDDDKPPAKVSAFGHQSDLPLRFGLVIDASASVTDRFDFEQDAASRFMREILRSEMDRAFIMGFSEGTTLIQDYTNDIQKLVDGLSALHAHGGTALFDAVRAACWKLAMANNQGSTAHILVLISDGEDNASHSTLKETIETAQREEVSIYSISTNNSGHAGIGDKTLKELAVQTGGQIFLPHSAKQMVNTFSAIEQEMRSRYALAYQPADLRDDGRFHRIEIKAQKSNKKFRVRARKGYYAPLTLFGN